MSQNRSKVVDVFVGNIVNAIVHRILRQSVSDESFLKRYLGEENTSLECARRYREKMNPIKKALPSGEGVFLQDLIRRKVMAKIVARISDGYQGVSIDSVEGAVQEALREVNVL